MLKKNQGYRGDIDGLRALAVLIVVLFHAYPNDLRSGFIGVDIFFVISGYLISRAILSQLIVDDFSFSRFYQARIRRIFPALIVVLATTAAVGWYTLLVRDFEALGKHLASGAGFVSNMTLWLESGYFDASAEKKPLLHLWSLGVEEQFYLFFPLLLWTMSRWTGQVLSVILVAMAVSFASNLLLVDNHPAAAYYLPHARFWGLMGGALLVCMEIRAEAGQRFALGANLRAWVGVAMLGVGIYLISPDRQFPGWWALLPIGGTVLLISARESWFNRRILTLRGLGWLGRISYPLYLWHWVLLAFCHIFEEAFPFHETRNPAIIVAFVLAWLTYEYVEKPIRFGQFKSMNPYCLLVPMSLILTLGLFIYGNQGVPSRNAALVQVMNAGDIGHSEFRAYMATRFFDCGNEGWGGSVTEQGVESRCLRSNVGRQAGSIFLVGDSHAEHLFIGLVETFPGRTFIYATRQGLPLVSNPGFGPLFARIARSPEIDGVVISAHWVSKLKEQDAEALETNLLATLDYFNAAGKKVYLFDDVPAFHMNPELCAYGDRLWMRNRCDARISDVNLTAVDLRQMSERLKQQFPGLVYVNPSTYFCGNDGCWMGRNGQLFYRDRNHLNIAGSRYVAQSLRHEKPDFFESE